MNFPNAISDILISDEYNLNLRNLAALALNVLANEDKRATEIISNLEKFDGLSNILAYNENYPLTLSVNVLQIFLGIATYPNLRAEVVDDVVIDAFLICIQVG